MIVIYHRNESMIVIYDHNDTGRYYKTMILANLALAMSINYDRKTFIVQATEVVLTKLHFLRNLQMSPIS
jgi:hypothetical protein